MTRPRFDPSRISSRAAPEPAGETPLTVSDLSGMIRGTLERGLPATVRVVGQIANLSRRQHWYFSLRDEHATISCVAWASDAAGFGFVPAEGDELLATGSVTHYPPQGRTQLYVRRLAPVGAGALKARFDAMCRELRALGYFEDARKRALPLLPRRIAIVTSAGGAAIHDVVATARQRCPAVGLLLVDARVQGDGAAADVAHAIRWIDRRAADLAVDAILVTRGGGSLEDLWAFNERVVADAIFRCRLPVVAAIGHESDVTVAELVADLRASTPTQATMRLVPDRAALLEQTTSLDRRLMLLVRRRVERERARTTGLARHPFLRDPAALVRPLREATARRRAALDHAVAARLADRRLRLARLEGRLARQAPHRALAQQRAAVVALSTRLARAAESRLAAAERRLGGAARLAPAARRRLERGRDRLDGLARALAALDPERILARGFTWTLGPDGRVLRSAAEVRSGDQLITVLADGRVASIARGRIDAEPAPRRRPSADEGPELFARR